MITKKDFEKAAKRRFLTEDVDPLGEVRIRSLTAREQYVLGTVLEDLGALGELDGISQTAVLIIFTICNKEGEPLFTIKDPNSCKEGELLIDREEIKIIEGISNKAITKLSKIIKDHLGYGGEEEETDDPGK